MVVEKLLVVPGFCGSHAPVGGVAPELRFAVTDSVVVICGASDAVFTVMGPAVVEKPPPVGLAA
jgi:hypothetical protein